MSDAPAEDPKGGAERRRYPRFPVKLKVTIGDKDERELMSENISLGGLFLSTDEEIGASGDAISIHLMLPADTGTPGEEVVVPALIRHAIPPIGYGIEFEVGPGHADWEKLSRYVEHLAAVRAELEALT